MTAEQIVVEAMRESLGVLPEDINLPLSELGLDSIDFIDLIYNIETKADIDKLFDADMRTVPLSQSDLIQLVDRKMLSKA